MAELHKKYSDQGFHIIALEAQGSSAQDITSMLGGKGAKYQATTRGRLAGANVSGIPHGFLFGPDGKLAADNPHGRELEEKVKELLTQTYAAMAGPGPYVKLALQAAQVRTGKGLGGVLKQLRTKVKSSDEAEAKEAQMMLDSLGGGAQAQLDKAVAKKATDPLGAIKTLDKLALDFIGDEISVNAKKAADELRRDPAVKKELEAAAIWAKVEVMNEGLKPVRGIKNPKDSDFRKANMAAIQQMIGGCQMIEQRYPGTQAAEQAKALMDQYR